MGKQQTGVDNSNNTAPAVPTQNNTASVQLTDAQLLRQRKDKFDSMWAKVAPKLVDILPATVTVGYFTRAIMVSLSKTPKLYDCDPLSLLAAVVQCAQLGLIPDPLFAEAHLIPFNRKIKGTDGKVTKSVMECSLIVGYKGYKKLVKNTGNVKELEAFAVYKGDHYIPRSGYNAPIDHILAADDSDRKYDDPIWVYDNLIYAYAVVYYKDGSHKVEVMPKGKIEQRRKKSKGQVKWVGNSPQVSDKPVDIWAENYEKMALKTVIRELCGQIDQSAELREAVSLDTQAEILNRPQENVLKIMQEMPDLLPEGDMTHALQIASEYQAGEEAEQRQNNTNESKANAISGAENVILNAGQKKAEELKAETPAVAAEGKQAFNIICDKPGEYKDAFGDDVFLDAGWVLEPDDMIPGIYKYPGIETSFKESVLIKYAGAFRKEAI